MWLCLLLCYLFPLVFTRSITSSSSECSFISSDYSLSWSYDDTNDEVLFNLNARSSLPDFWSGLYIGNDIPKDAIGVFVRGGQIGLIDGHINGNGVQTDDIVDVETLRFDLQQGNLTAEFSRPIKTGDDNDMDLSQCVTFFFPLSAPAIEDGITVNLPSNMKTQTVCNINTNCKIQKNEVVKREEPPQCDFHQGNNKISWKSEKDSIVFTIEQQSKKGKWWTAIGAGDGMQNMKMAMAFTENGKIKSLGGFKSDTYGPPHEDKTVLPVLNKKLTKVVNGHSNIIFTLSKEFFAEFTNPEGCVTLHFGILAGNYPGKYTISKHETTPESVSVCGIDQCKAEKKEPAHAPGKEREAGKETEVVKKAEAAPLESSEPVNNEEIPAANNSTGEVEEGSGEDSVNTTSNEAIPEGSGEQPQVDNSSLTSQPAENRTNINDQPLLSDNSSSVSLSPLIDNSTELPTSDNSSVLPVLEGSNTTNNTELVTNSDNSTQSTENHSSISSIISEELSNQTSSQNSTIDEEEPNQAHNATVLGEENKEEVTNTTASSIHEGDVEKNSTETDANTAENNENQAETRNETTLLEANGSNSTNINETAEEHGTDVDGHPEGLASSTPHPINLPTEHGTENGTIISHGNGTEKAQIEGCKENHMDLKVCDGYFKDYIGKVEAWADRHNQTLGQQMWKACQLLSEVKNVPTLCCGIFHQTCSSQLQH